MKGIIILLADNGFFVEYGTIPDYAPGQRSAKKIADCGPDMLRIVEKAVDELLAQDERRFMGTLQRPTPGKDLPT